MSVHPFQPAVPRVKPIPDATARAVLFGMMDDLQLLALEDPRLLRRLARIIRTAARGAPRQRSQ